MHTKKILLVDDELELRKLVIDILSDDGFLNIMDAGTVQTGLFFAMHEKPDLAILDVMLPDGDGFSLMKKLRTFTNIPIIFLTAKDEAADKLAGLGLGADDYVVKPFLPQELLLRVHAVLRRCYHCSDCKRTYAVRNLIPQRRENCKHRRFMRSLVGR